jgi:hypothetical protein
MMSWSGKNGKKVPVFSQRREFKKRSNIEKELEILTAQVETGS